MINEILALVPKQFFKKLTEQYQSDRYKKRFKTWDQLVVMLIGQLSGARSLGDLALSMMKANNKYKKEGKALLSLIDSSPIRVSGRGGQWAKANGSRKGTEGLKLHQKVLDLENSPQLPLELNYAA
jgi:hypothetical protein